MTTDNLHIWSQLERTDPEQTKGFQRPGGFKGTAVKPIYAIRKMTEVFGPCGQGWGTDDPQFQIVGDAVFCTVGLWWGAHEGDPRRVYGIGGDLIVKRPRSGEPYHDDEAFKKAYTDALTNAMKLLGMSADVHMGLFDDSKYVASARQMAQDERNGSSGHDTPPATPSRSSADPSANGGASRLTAKRAKEIMAALKDAPNLDALDKLWSRLVPEIVTASVDGQRAIKDVYDEMTVAHGGKLMPGAPSFQDEVELLG